MDKWLGIYEDPGPMIKDIEPFILRPPEPKPEKILSKDNVDRTPRYIGKIARIRKTEKYASWYKLIKAEREAEKQARDVPKMPEYSLNYDQVRRYNRDIRNKYGIAELNTSAVRQNSMIESNY